MASRSGCLTSFESASNPAFAGHLKLMEVQDSWDVHATFVVGDLPHISVYDLDEKLVARFNMVRSVGGLQLSPADYKSLLTYAKHYRSEFIKKVSDWHTQLNAPPSSSSASAAAAVPAPLTTSVLPANSNWAGAHAHEKQFPSLPKK